MLDAEVAFYQVTFRPLLLQSYLTFFFLQVNHSVLFFLSLFSFLEWKGPGNHHLNHYLGDHQHGLSWSQLDLIQHTPVVVTMMKALIQLELRY